MNNVTVLSDNFITKLMHNKEDPKNDYGLKWKIKTDVSITLILRIEKIKN